MQMRKHVLVLDKVSLELFWAEWILDVLSLDGRTCKYGVLLTHYLVADSSLFLVSLPFCDIG